MRTIRLLPILLLCLALTGNPLAGLADEYSQRRAAVRKRDSGQRRVPVIPPRDQRLRVIIDTDARNEIDDLWAVALAVRCPDRFQIQGFIGALRLSVIF